MKTQLTHPILQYPTDLIFAITQCDVSQQLTTLKTQTVKVADYTFEFTIIGESHCITLLHQNKFIQQEVLACTDIPAILQADSHKFDKLDMYHYQKPNYQARVWFSDIYAELDRYQQDTLRMDFPEIFGQIPFTEIRWHSSQSMMQWRTTHVYPLQTHTTYVYTESSYDLTERSNNE